mgnify:CR=1 FL=1
MHSSCMHTCDSDFDFAAAARLSAFLNTLFPSLMRASLEASETWDPGCVGRMRPGYMMRGQDEVVMDPGLH